MFGRLNRRPDVFNIIKQDGSKSAIDLRSNTSATLVADIPDLGTLVPWTNNTIWYTAGAANPSGFYTQAVRPIIQLMYAHQAIRIASGATMSLGIRTTQTGGNWRWQFAVSGTDSFIGNFQTPFYGSASHGPGSVTGGQTYTGVTNVEFVIPANRYFLIIRSPGPLYTSSSAASSNVNRTATIDDVPVFTTICNSVVGNSTGVTTTVTNLPTQFGGSDAGYVDVAGYNPAFGATFTVG